ncbi:hypothetical protein, unlikely [Trypanosoma brucei gambiense DAL972]|uniref:Uncharacterized protein n=1 Tax=Trypanosoma brucei gambiense (strain MHOM/CI/86/DAL972) TaxID=679716 RepID=D0A3Y7_TRYB9|nr:hypothetical protein, unlikely [Trypanosoma brucei gambiense DAL972]CBH15981.1 hypothetical protein, unlikely [Trypanosoma brucei gambiense DAL972]|eukprot:XP_011778245.1 hypothetical protein, unlikely [Trypanosoma brucei gambiense DAL972]
MFAHATHMTSFPHSLSHIYVYMYLSFPIYSNKAVNDTCTRVWQRLQGCIHILFTMVIHIIFSSISSLLFLSNNKYQQLPHQRSLLRKLSRFRRTFHPTVFFTAPPPSLYICIFYSISMCVQDSVLHPSPLKHNVYT